MGRYRECCWWAVEAESGPAYRESIGLVAIVVGEKKFHGKAQSHQRLFPPIKRKSSFGRWKQGRGLYESFSVAEQDEGKNRTKKTKGGSRKRGRGRERER